MIVSDDERLEAEQRMADRLKAYPRAVRARYDRHASRIVIGLNTGLDILLPIRLTQGLPGRLG